jgi:signal transduction histidine kinase
MKSVLRVFLLAIIASVAVLLSILSYQYSNYISSQAISISDQDIRLNSEITSHDLSRVLANKIGNVFDNLQLIATSKSVKEQRVDRAASLFETGQASTKEITDSYFWIDKDGKLLWADAFSNQTIYEQYKAGDRSQRSYYLVPKQTLQPYISAVIESVDGVPRLYVSYPVLADDNIANPGSKSFNGVVVAASDLKQIGQFLNTEISPKMPSSVGLTDKNGRILYSNTQSLIGKDVFGQETQSILPNEMKDTFNSIIKDALAGKTGSGDFTYNGTTTTISYEPVITEGRDFGVLYVITPHTIAGSTSSLIDQERNFSTIIILVIGAVAVGIAFVILTWNKRLKDTVAQRNEELRRSNESLQTAVEQLKTHDKMQQEFINIAAHELRTPIQPLLGVVETMRISMQEEGKNTIELSEDEIAMLERNARRLERLTKNILDITRIESNRLALDKERFDMNQKISNVIRDIAGINPEIKDGKKIVAVSGYGSSTRDSVIEFTPSADPLFVNADKTRIFEVLSNLIKNAIKFTKDGKIEVRLSAVEGKVLVEIKDSGRGIDPEVMPRLFTKFTTKSESGTGLGLYISKSIVEAHGGKMWAENNKDGRGAIFRFNLPLAPALGSAITEYAQEKEDYRGLK